MTVLTDRLSSAVAQSRTQGAVVPVPIRPDELDEVLTALWRVTTASGTELVRPREINPIDDSVTVFARIPGAPRGVWLWKLRLLIGLAPTAAHET